MTPAPPAPAPTAPARPPISTGLRLAIDIGPLAVFFLVNMFAPGIALTKLLAATVAFMIASATAMIVSKLKAGHISPMLWISGTLVLVFGGLTLYFHDGTFIKMKPTFVYTMFAAILAYGLATRKPLLQMLLDTAYPGVNAAGWRKLTRNWAIFFVLMALLNEYVWRTYAPLPDSDTKIWAGFKLWGAVPLTLIFAFANVPMLLKHGLKVGEEPPVPPEG
ncbi:inner membrane-spanning protein YciB [Sphingomonas qilianensis]|uniref:Inner membrane-spanning protein YciB n=1 Tax=Sphingomonas qilianensis TaxID=1736690 RepID=A0ABU9XPA6_9SPHN